MLVPLNCSLRQATGNAGDIVADGGVTRRLRAAREEISRSGFATMSPRRNATSPGPGQPGDTPRITRPSARAVNGRPAPGASTLVVACPCSYPRPTGPGCHVGRHGRGDVGGRPVPAPAPRARLPDRRRLQVLRRPGRVPGRADHVLRLPVAVPAAPAAGVGARLPPARRQRPAHAHPRLDDQPVPGDRRAAPATRAGSRAAASPSPSARSSPSTAPSASRRPCRTRRTSPGRSRATIARTRSRPGCAAC